MSSEYHDDWIPDNVDPLDAPDQDFDWDELYGRLSEDAEGPQHDPELAQTVVRLLQLLIPPNTGQRLQAKSLGLRLIALAWLLNPGYFEGSPSLRTLAKRCGIRIASLANYTGHYSRLLGWRNRAQSHAWNWCQKGAPRQRGETDPKKVKRIVPRSGKGTKTKPGLGSNGGKESEA
jgi:hypothetical protein